MIIAIANVITSPTSLGCKTDTGEDIRVMPTPRNILQSKITLWTNHSVKNIHMTTPQKSAARITRGCKAVSSLSPSFYRASYVMFIAALEINNIGLLRS
jgi:hypothetical protein